MQYYVYYSGINMYCAHSTTLVQVFVMYKLQAPSNLQTKLLCNSASSKSLIYKYYYYTGPSARHCNKGKFQPMGEPNCFKSYCKIAHTTSC